MTKIVKITCGKNPGITLRSINQHDQENLMEWKNANRTRFFFTDIITPESQQKWYDGFKSRPDDYMFIVETSKGDIGCMGIRLKEDNWDIYNVILGRPDLTEHGVMSRAFNMKCNFALQQKNLAIRANVLSDNPALKWYLKNGFKVISTETEHVVIEIDYGRFDINEVETNRN